MALLAVKRPIRIQEIRYVCVEHVRSIYLGTVGVI